MDSIRTSKLLPLVVVVALTIFYARVWAGGVLTYGDLGGYFTNLVLEYRKSWQELNFFWTSGIGNGYPLLGNQQMGFGYLPDILYLLPFSPLRVLTIHLVFHHLLLTLGCYFLFRKLVEGPWAVWGALSVAWMGVSISVISMTHNFVTLSWLPWLSLALWNMFRTDARDLWAIFWLWFCSYNLFAGGDPQFYVFAVGLILLLPWRWSRRNLIVAALVLVSAQLCQIHTLSFLESVKFSARSKGFLAAASDSWNLDVPLGLSAFQPSSVFCDLLGRAWDQLNGRLSRQNWIESLYVGALVPALALQAWKRPRRILDWVFGLFLVASLVVATGVVLQKCGIVWTHIPVLGMVRYPVRFALLPFLFLHAAALLGVRRILSGEVGLVSAALVAALVAALILVLCGLHPFARETGHSHLLVWQYRMLLESAIQIGLLVAFLIVILLAKTRWVGLSLALLLAVDLGLTLHAAWRQMEVSHPREAGTDVFLQRAKFGEHPKVLVSAQDEYMDSLKVNAAIENLTVDSSKISKLEQIGDISGNTVGNENLKAAGVEVFKSYLELQPKIPWGYMNMVLKEHSPDHFRNMLWHTGATDVITMVGKDGNPVRGFPGMQMRNYMRITGVPAIRLEFPGTMPRFLVLDQVDRSGNYDRMREVDNRTSSVAITDGVDCSVPVHKAALSWLRYSDAHWVVKTHDARGLLGFRQTVYPGWKAYVDGKPVPDLRVNIINQGVCLDHPNREVEFRFVPRFLWLQLVLIALGAGLLVSLLWWAHSTDRMAIPGAIS